MIGPSALDVTTAVEVRPWLAAGCIEQALRADEIMHVFQPIWGLDDGELVGFEALARFPDETPPDAVWRAAETSGVSLDLDRVSIRSALIQGAHLPGRLFVNVSAPNLGSTCRPGAAVLRTMHAHRDGTASVVLEVTESAFASPAQMRRDVQRMKRLGVALALDDAGECAATLARLVLMRPALGFVKLAPRMIRAWLEGRAGDLPRWMAALRSGGLQAIAEGVEDRGVASRLLDADIRYVQGYAFGVPEPAEAWTPDRLAAMRPGGRETDTR